MVGVRGDEHCFSYNSFDLIHLIDIRKQFSIPFRGLEPKVGEKCDYIVHSKFNSPTIVVTFSRQLLDSPLPSVIPFSQSVIQLHFPKSPSPLSVWYGGVGLVPLLVGLGLLSS